MIKEEKIDVIFTHEDVNIKSIFGFLGFMFDLVGTFISLAFAVFANAMQYSVQSV